MLFEGLKNNSYKLISHDTLQFSEMMPILQKLLYRE
jgi:hypothetical protein